MSFIDFENSIKNDKEPIKVIPRKDKAKAKVTLNPVIPNQVWT